MARTSYHTIPTNLDYPPGHIVGTIPGIHLITVVAIPAIEEITMICTIVTIDDHTVTTVDRTGMIGIETGLIEVIGHTAMIIDTTGTTTLIIARGADLVDVTTVVGIMTRYWIMMDSSPRLSCSITVGAGE